MNKILLSILLFFLCTSQFHAQEFSMTDQGNRWGIRSYDGLCEDPETMGCTVTNLLGYRVNGEIIINEITYSILERALDVNPSWSTYGFIREDNGVVYSYSESDGEETILYDFTLEIGDSIAPDFESDCFSDTNNNGLADVTDVSIQFIAGKNRKVITFDVYNNNNFSNIEFEQWIEGIGSVSNIIQPFAPYCDIAIALNCFNDGNDLFLFDESEEECDSLLNIQENSLITTTLTPNPITDQSQFSISKLENNTTLSFYNILGQFIDQKEILSNTTTINHSDFPASGIYFYQLQQEGKIISTQKFIVR